MYGNEVLSAYGRLWTADVTGDKSTIYWSDLLIGHDWSGGTSGSINISKVWPDGYDEIVALAAHNGLLIIFGRTSIIVYQGAQAPATMALADTVSGIGCVDRDTVQYTGTDVLFLSHTGLKSFGRTIQEKSMPISSLSGAITRDVINAINAETEFFRSVYSPEENFYLLAFTGQNLIYCFDVRGTTEAGSYRVTRWVNTGFTSFARLDNGTLYIGSSNGIGEYNGYSDNGDAYQFKYYSPSLTFGDSSRIKFLKKARPVIVGGGGYTPTFRYAYDFQNNFKQVAFEIPPDKAAYFNINEFGADSNPLSEYTDGGVQLTSRRSFNASGNGSSVVVGIETEINGSEFSIQEINLLATIGKTV